MKKKAGIRSERVAIGIFVALACGGIPFFFVHGVWGELLQKAYLLTVFLFFILLWSYWELTSEPWFWKAIAAVVLAHSGIVFGMARLNFEFPAIDRLPRVVYSALTVVLVGEVLGSMRIINACRPKERGSKMADRSGPEE